jgi:tetratricopeptide (TPR) repeat protein
VGLVAGLALACYAPAIFFDGLLQKSVLDMFFVCLGIWLISRLLTGASTRGSWMALGLAMGGLSLTRENALVFIVVIAAWAVVDHARRAHVATFAAGLAIVLAPVAARNHAVGGGFYLTTSQFGANLYIGNHPGADGTYAPIRYGRGSPQFERQDATEVAEHALARKLSPSEVSSYWTARALDFITSQPGQWLALTGRKLLLLVNAAEMVDTESQESYAEWSWPLRVGGFIGHFGFLVPLALVGVIITWPSRRRLWVVHTMTLAYAGSVVMFYVFARYRYPLVPFLLLFAAAGVVGARRFWRTALASQRVGTLAIAAVAGVVANWPLLSTPLMKAVTEYNLGTALKDGKRLDQAIVHYQRAIVLQPDYAPAHNNLGAALRATGRPDEAIAQYRRALALKPDFGDASYNLASALLEQGQASASVAQFRNALRSWPDSVQAHNNLAIALAATGDMTGAIAEFRATLAIDDRSVQAHRNLGHMLVEMGLRAEGIAHLERAVQVAPGEADASFDIGRILLAERNFAGAAERFEAALRVRPAWAEAHNSLGIALASLGRPDQAIEEFRRALALDPDLQDARQNLAAARRHTP